MTVEMDINFYENPYLIGLFPSIRFMWIITREMDRAMFEAAKSAFLWVFSAVQQLITVINNSEHTL